MYGRLHIHFSARAFCTPDPLHKYGPRAISETNPEMLLSYQAVVESRTQTHTVTLWLFE